jgi:hypothetical protein
MPIEIFYGTLTEPITRREIGMARKICGPCPVRTDCLIASFESKEPHGVWGGITHRERHALLSKHKWNWQSAARAAIAKQQAAATAAIAKQRERMSA